MAKRKAKQSQPTFDPTEHPVLVLAVAIVLLWVALPWWARILLVLLALAVAALVFSILLTRRQAEMQKLVNIGLPDIDQMPGREFEEFLAGFFTRDSYKAELTPITGDFGADIILERYGKRTAVQVKRQVSNVGVKAVYEVVASKKTYGCSQAMVITNSYFTRAAVKSAKDNGVELWDRERLIAELTRAKEGEKG